MIILDYFTVKLSWKDDVPKIKFIPKPSKVKTKVPLRVNSNMPYSAMEREYYTIFGDTIDLDDLYNERKQLASKTKLIEWYIINIDCDNNTKNRLRNAIQTIKNNLSKSLKEHYSSEAGIETKRKLKTRTKKWAPIIANRNKEKWKDLEWASAEMKRRYSSGQYQRVKETNKAIYSDKQFMEQFVEKINSSERLAKISKKSKELWQSPEYVNKVLGQARNKNVTVNGYRMNIPESMIALILNKLAVDWVYENPVLVGTKTYIPDFTLKDKKIIIEVFGDFWHANPKNYDADDVVFSTKRAKDIWEKDYVKKQTLENAGYRVYIIWQDDINLQYDKVEEMLHEIC